MNAAREFCVCEARCAGECGCGWWSANERERRNSPCAQCGFDPEAKVTARWQFFLSMLPPSQNEMKGMNRFAYQKIRDAFTLLVRAAKNKHGVTTAEGKRRLTITRIYSGRCKELDRGNFIGGCKPLLDALKIEGVIVDDRSALLEDHYQQRRDDMLKGIEVIVEELA